MAIDAISSAVPSLPIGCRAIKSFFAWTGSGLWFNLSCQEGEKTVPGAIELHLIFCFTKSEAIDFVKPIIAAFDAP